MFKNISIKFQLLTIPIVVVVAFLSLYMLVSSNLTKLDDKAYKASQANKMIKNMLEARIAEKNYTRRKDLTYVKVLEGLLHKNIEIAKELESKFTNTENIASAAKTRELFQEYLLMFSKYQKIREESLQTEKDMTRAARTVTELALAARAIQKGQKEKLIKNKASLNKIIDKVNKASFTNKIIKELKDIRIAEKNYIRRKNTQYILLIDEKIANIDIITNTLKKDFKSQKNKDMIDAIDETLKVYNNEFDLFVELRENSIKLSSQMKEIARKAKKLSMQVRFEQKEQREKIKESFKISLITIFILSSVFIIFISIMISKSVLKNLFAINKAAEDLATGEGDLTKRIILENKNEIEDVAHNINRFIKKVQDAIVESKTVSAEASSISSELSATSLEIGKRVEEESLLVKSVNVTTDETLEESRFVDDTVKKMHEVSDKSFMELQDATKKITSLIETVKDTSVKEIELSQKMEELRDSTNDVKSILELIGDIAEQTNLLSLNAAIEAARAGEHGRGFAVVADEVRKLAERTQKSLVEINATINVVTQAVEDASDNMQANANEIADAAEKASDVEESIDSVMSSIKSTKTMASDSSKAVDKLKESIGDISNKMQELNDVSNSNARSVEEIATAAEHQNNIMEKLNHQLSSFKS